LKPTRHREVASQRITNQAIPGRYRAHRNGHIEHVIIEGEVVAGDLVQPFGFCMAVQWRRRSSEPTSSRSFGELFFAQWRLERPLQLPTNSDPGIPRCEHGHDAASPPTMAGCRYTSTTTLPFSTMAG
jgi:hypothetical protein